MRSVNSARARRSTSSNSGKLNVKRKKVRSTVMNIKNGKEKNKIVAKEQKLESAKLKKKKQTTIKLTEAQKKIHPPKLLYFLHICQ